MSAADPLPDASPQAAAPQPGAGGLPAPEDRPGLSLLVAAGGTGGHVFPGLALARTIVQHDPKATVRFAGTTRGIETRAVPEAGFALDLLPILPLSRRLARETLLAVGARLVYREIEDLSHTYPRDENPRVLDWLTAKA